MTCEDFLAKYSEYADGRLDPAVEAAVRAHLRACGPCARYDRVLAEGRGIVAGLPEIEPSYDFEPRLRHRIYHVEEELRRERGADAGGVAALGVASFLVVAVWSTVMVATEAGAVADAEQGVEAARVVATESAAAATQPAAPAESGAFEPLADPAVWVDARQAWWHEHARPGERLVADSEPRQRGESTMPSLWALDGARTWPGWTGRRFPPLPRLDGHGASSYSPLVVGSPFYAGSSGIRPVTSRRAAPE